MIRHRSRTVLLAWLFGCTVCLCLWASGLKVQAVPVAQASADQVEQGVQRYQAGDYQGAIQRWQAALTAYQKAGDEPKQAIVLENLARAKQQLGQYEPAIADWQQLTELHRRQGNPVQVGRMQTELAQAYSAVGQPRQAITLLCSAAEASITTIESAAPVQWETACTAGSAVHIAQAQRDRPGAAAAFGSLGEAYRLRGHYDRAIAAFQASLAQTDAPDRVAALHGLGNVAINLAQSNYRRASSAEQQGDVEEAEVFQKTARQYDQQALAYYQQSAQLAQAQPDRVAELRSRLNAIPAYQRTQATAEAATALREVRYLLQQLPDSRPKVFALIDLAQHLQPINPLERVSSRERCLPPSLQSQAEGLLQQAVLMAQQLSDRRAASFALGELGHLYECRQNYGQALSFTRQAQWAADQNLQAKDSLYLWEWQLGRILQAQGQTTAAIAAYERSLATLDTIRSDILTANRDVQFDFRDTVEPIYRELVALKLSQETPAVSAQPKQLQPQSSKALGSVLTTIDSLKLAELQDYFGNDCVVTVANQTVDPAAQSATAVISTIILEDKTAVIASFPGQQRQFAWIPLGREQVIDQVNEFRRGLERWRENYDPAQAQVVYNWLIAPFAAGLQQAQVKTLVFVHDGIFRSVPMAALHDGQQFLIQRYAIATTPSLSLTTPDSLQRDQLRVLLLGLTEAATVDGRTLDELAGVAQEISGIKDQIPTSTELINENFTRDRMAEELRQSVYPIIHIATHGRFGLDPQDTFIVTGDRQKLTLNELDRLIRSTTRNTEPLELLALTACQTALGDNRSALGLAGVAVQAGAKSAIASLWLINDVATAKLATTFYANLRQPTVSKAEALRMAQLALLTGTSTDRTDYTHPAYWASLMLVGNWL